MENKQRLSRKELSKISGFRESTIKYYTEKGLLPFEQLGEGLIRKYPKKEALARLKQIKSLKTQGRAIEEIKKKL